MGRKPRNYYEGGIYHVMQRGNNQNFIFDEQLDKAMFCQILKDTMVELPFNLLYYVLMDNHYHLVIQMKEVHIGQVMHKINLTYSKFYNQKYNRSGTIFGSRFTSIMVKDSVHFFRLILYVAVNPVKSGLVKHPKDYRWSAHMEVVSSRQFIINRKALLSFFHTEENKSVTMYTQLLEDWLNGVTHFENEDQIKERHQQIMRTLLRELVDSDELFERVLSRERSDQVINVKKRFIEVAASRGFETVEIAIFLNLAPRTVREHRAKKCRTSL